MKELRRRWGDEELAAEKVMKRRLEWLGHIARIRPSAAQVNVVWLAPSTTPQVWSKEEVERRSAKEPEGYWNE